MISYQVFIFELIDLCEKFGMEWNWLDDDKGRGLQVDMSTIDEFSRHRFIRETRKLKRDFLRIY
ncbi:MAG: hypothetical protein KAX49_10650 [Halanaerobiales bacterium]|nr:hypothetical protein [Halanaerobiales bacterium]